MNSTDKQCHVCGLYPSETCWRALCMRNSRPSVPQPTWPVTAWPTTLSETQKGCICPPTSEQTCKRPDCGRKPYERAAGGQR